MSKQRNVEFLVASLNRAIRTIAQTALSMLGIGMAISDVDWLNVLSVSLVAGLISILTSYATGLPEAATDGTLTIMDVNDPVEGASVVLGLKLDKEVTPELAKELLDKGTVNLRVEE